MMKNLGFRLYLVTDRRLAGKDLLTAVRASLDGGVKAVQLREKDMEGGELFSLAGKLRRLTSGYGARLFINGRVDVALAVDADGVHLGQNGFSPADIKKIIGKDKIVGVSTHSVSEAIKAQKLGAHFITLGPIYQTPSKAKYGEPIGLEPIRKAKKTLKIPVFAVGGIKKEKIQEVIEAGSYGVACISAIIKTRNAGKSAGEILSELKSAGNFFGRGHTSAGTHPKDGSGSGSG